MSLGDGARQLIRDFQPYARSDPFTDDPLWLLREIQDIDKHRFLVNVTLDVDQLKWRAFRATGEEVRAFTVQPDVTVDFVPGPAFLEGARVEDGMELGRWHVNPPDPELKLEVKPGFLIVLDEGPGKGKTVSSTLNYVFGHVEHILNEAKRLPECQ